MNLYGTLARGHEDRQADRRRRTLSLADYDEIAAAVLNG